MAKKRSLINSFLIFLLFFCLAACSDNKLEKKKSEQSMTKQEDNFKEFLLKGIDAGTRIWELKGDTAVFSMDNPEQVNIQKPDVMFYDKKDPLKVSATVTAKEADVNTKTKDMHATGDVVMFSAEENAKLFTEEVFYRNSDAIFYSDKPVRVERDDSITEGIGFDAKSDLSEINIKNNVSISYKSTETTSTEDES